MELASRGMKASRGGHGRDLGYEPRQAWEWHPASSHHVGNSMLLLLLLGGPQGNWWKAGGRQGLAVRLGQVQDFIRVGLAHLLRRPGSYPVPHCSIAKPCLILCDPMDCRVTSFRVLHYFPGFVQTHVYKVGDAIQPSHALCCPLFFIHNYILWGFCRLFVHIALTHILFFIYGTLLKKNKSIASRAITWSLIHWQLASFVLLYIKQCIGI